MTDTNLGHILFSILVLGQNHICKIKLVFFTYGLNVRLTTFILSMKFPKILRNPLDLFIALSCSTKCISLSVHINHKRIL